MDIMGTLKRGAQEHGCPDRQRLLPPTRTPSGPSRLPPRCTHLRGHGPLHGGLLPASLRCEPHECGTSDGSLRGPGSMRGFGSVPKQTRKEQSTSRFGAEGRKGRPQTVAPGLEAGRVHAAFPSPSFPLICGPAGGLGAVR